MIIDWPSIVNTRILRNGTDWSGISGVKEDQTRSGVPKRRLDGSAKKRPFNIKMRFTEIEYHTFDSWYVNKCKNGFHAFNFPVIDTSGKVKGYKSYQFAAGSAPKYTNPSGNYVDCTMQWEEY